MRLSFTSYWPLLLLVALPVLVWLGRRSATGLGARHLRVSTALRVIVLLLVALACMHPVLHHAARELSVVYALDVSRSVSPAFIEKSIEWIRSANTEGKPDHTAYVAFADKPVVVGKAEEIRSISVTTGGAAAPAGADVLDQSQTNLERALLEALHNLAPHHRKRLVLFSDGNATEGELARAVARARAEDVRVFSVPADVRAPGDAWIEAVDLPDVVSVDEPVEAVVRVFSRDQTRGRVELARNGVVLGRKDADLAPGRSRVTVEVRLDRAGLNRLDATLRADGDPFPDNDRHPLSVSVAEKPKVLYVEGRPESASYLESALSQSGIAVTVGGTLPDTERALAAYDAVILSDLPYSSLTAAAQTALSTYVRDGGGGLVFAGGETSYGESGYAGSTLEDVLPVRFQIKEKHKELALIVILDKSYSMLGSKLDLSKEATIAALDLLDETHRFGVVTFNWDPYVTVPLQEVGKKTAIKEEVSRIQASGQTNIYPALRSAFAQLLESTAKVKHVILLSDGKTYPNEFQSLLERMVSSEMTVSAVAVGEEADRELLGNIAKWGKGRSYYLQDARRVPQIFIEETQLAVQTTLVEKPFRPVVLENVEALDGVDFGAAPLLKGHVSTEAKETAEVILEAEPEKPLLARWQYGLGKAVAFTSDVKNRWAADWMSWPGYGKFWSQLVRETSRRREPDDVALRVYRSGSRAVVDMTAVGPDGRHQNGLRPVVSVASGANAPRPLGVPQVAPGAYRIEVPLVSSPEAYRFDLSFGAGAPRRAELFFPYPDEYRFYPANAKLLRALSEETGGVFRPEIRDVFKDYADSGTVPTPLAPWLIGVALVLWLTDVAVRRVPWVWARLSAAES